MSNSKVQHNLVILFACVHWKKYVISTMKRNVCGYPCSQNFKGVGAYSAIRLKNNVEKWWVIHQQLRKVVLIFYKKYYLEIKPHLNKWCKRTVFYTQRSLHVNYCFAKFFLVKKFWLRISLCSFGFILRKKCNLLKYVCKIWYVVIKLFLMFELISLNTNV